jgi:hypothetical protein
MASTGQVSTQTPQSMQASGLIFALSSAMLIASLGHSSTQDSQPVHFSSSTLADIALSFQKRNLQTNKTEMLQNYFDITIQIFKIR